MRTRIFGTDGIRDIANQGYLTPEAVSKLGRIIGFLLKQEPEIFLNHRLPRKLRLPKHQQRQTNKNRVLIGRDTRISGQMIEQTLATALAAEGIDIIQLGIVPTPVLAYLTRRDNIPLGIIISASHNPYQHNGIKIFYSEGVKIPDRAERLIEEYLLDKQMMPASSSGGHLDEPIYFGQITNNEDRVQEYINDCTKNGPSLAGLKIVIDCANGATSFIAPEIFRQLGAQVITLHNNPDGTNINNGCGSLFPEVTRRAVLKYKANIGFSFDGDGDRLVMVDEKGIIRDGDYILAILGYHFKKHRKLTGNTIVATVMSNTGLAVSLQEANIKLIRTAVGDKNVLDEMFRKGYILGGEQSGHIIILNRSVTGDGIITALEILKVIRSGRKSLWRLCRSIKQYPQILVNLKVKSKPELSSLSGYEAKLTQAREGLGPNSQILIRYSGTEPLLRIMIEAEDKRRIKSVMNDLIKFFEKKIRGVLCN